MKAKKSEKGPLSETCLLQSKTPPGNREEGKRFPQRRVGQPDSSFHDQPMDSNSQDFEEGKTECMRRVRRRRGEIEWYK